MLIDSELFAKKRKLEEDVFKLIDDFENSTGYIVKDVAVPVVNRHFIYGCDEPALVRYHRLEINLEVAV